MFKKLLLTLPLLLSLIPNSGAAQDWTPIVSLYRCGLYDPNIYYDNLAAQGQRELFLGKARVVVFNETDQEYYPLDGIIVTHVGLESSQFTISILFNDNTFCELVSGIDFIPYTE
jgi:hypothetical protein